MQVFLALMAIGAGAWVAFSSTSYLLHDRILAAKDHQIASERLRHLSLVGELEAYHKRFTTVAGALEEYNRTALELVGQNTSLKKKYMSVESKLRSTQVERQSVVTARENLKARLAELEDD
ncbi:MAG: hypothetical protein MI741_08195, partial [Rhodospirillales bacterium]|nr:hypothetical protein [Rhodospirillales bacterium]